MQALQSEADRFRQELEDKRAALRKVVRQESTLSEDTAFLQEHVESLLKARPLPLS